MLNVALDGFKLDFTHIFVLMLVNLLTCLFNGYLVLILFILT